MLLVGVLRLVPEHYGGSAFEDAEGPRIQQDTGPIRYRSSYLPTNYFLTGYFLAGKKFSGATSSSG